MSDDPDNEWDLCPCPGCMSWLIESEHACRKCEEIELMNEEMEDIYW